MLFKCQGFEQVYSCILWYWLSETCLIAKTKVWDGPKSH
jgi:hypothetical protein